MLLILSLSACSSSSSDAECKEGICIKIEIEGPAQALQPIPFMIYFSTEKDITGLDISMYGNVSITISDIEKKPDEIKTTFQKGSSMHWQIDTKGGEEYVITGHITLAKPTVSYGVFSYDLFAAAGHPSIARVTDSITIYLDAEGKQVEESQAILELETDLPLPTQPTDMIVITRTPWPTIIWPTDTPLPTFTPTATTTPTASQTLPPYP